MSLDPANPGASRDEGGGAPARDDAASVSAERAPFWRWVPAVLSVAVFSFTVFKVLAFFLMPVALLLGLLLACHPLGVILGRRFYESRPQRGVRHYLLVLLLSIAAFPALGHLYESHFGVLSHTDAASSLLAYVAWTGALFIPFYAGSGVVELVVLRAAARDAERVHLAYAALLGCAVGGVALGWVALPVLGIPGLCLVAVHAAVAAAAPPTRRWRIAVGVSALVTIFGVGSAGRDVQAAMMLGLQPRVEQSTRSQIGRGATLLHAGWGKYAYVEIVRSADGRYVFGAYNGAVYWDTPVRYERDPTLLQQPFDSTVLRLVPGAGAFAVIGAGGGKQVQQALQEGRDLAIDAYELEPAVVAYFTGRGRDSNGGAYSAPGVRALAREGRGGVREAPGRYDAVYLADAGNFFNYYKTVLNFAFFLHTREAYADYVSSLKPEGVVAVLIMREVDRGVSQRIHNVLDSLGLARAEVANEKFVLTVAARGGDSASLRARVDRAAAGTGLAPSVTRPVDPSLANPVPTDDRGGSYIYALYPLATLEGVAVAAVFALVAGVGGALALRARRRAPPWLARLPPSRLLQAVALGASFTLLQNAVILDLAKLTLDIHDAAILGTVGFLVPAAAGAALGRQILARRGVAVALVLGAVAASLATSALGAAPAVAIGAQLGLFVLAGSWFPSLLRAIEPDALPGALAADSFGAAAASVAVFFVPVLHGVDALSWLAHGVAALAGLWVVVTARSTPVGAA
ncbi:MAG: hypothetical protein IT376_22315 [Polyangiaceae bacterium]|nr:hypothetical protein [Polyangiaceae bacterium]